jgi:hypothetical protein
MTTFYNKLSPYYTTNINSGYLDIINFRDIQGETDDINYEITKTYEYRPDLLAFDLYNDVNFWWVFAVRNKSIIKDPVFDFKAGVKIYLPKLSTIRTSLGI